jgi:LmbE family N-acetylglucosaminyl deacetylase
LFDHDTKGPILVLAPHPDDETLGAGGFLLRAASEGRPIHWLIATRMRPEDGWAADKMARREAEIKAVSEAYGFASVHILPFSAARLDTIPMGGLVAAIADVVKQVEPNIILLPHRGDAHSDHAAVHDAGAACAKWFRYPSVRWTMVYETLSETDAAVQNGEDFHPDIFVDIADYLEEKLRITSMFGDEIQAFPFPRSLQALRALAQTRGVSSGTTAAECFMLLRARV